MDWHRIRVLMAAVILASAGCTLREFQELPVLLELDEDLSDPELSGILAAVDEWNLLAGNRLVEPGPIFTVVGTHNDDFDERDLGDGVHRIYRIGENNGDTAYLEEENGPLVGYGTLSDVLIFLGAYDQWTQNDDVNDSDEWRATYVFNGAHHEFGHLLGIAHYNCRFGEMNTRGDAFREPRESLAEADLDAFCIVYDCRCGEPNRDRQVYP